MNLLIVDDDIYAIRAVEQMVALASVKFENVLTAVNIFQAETILLETPVDLLICDIEMPQGSGFELMEWMWERHIKIQVIFLTAYDNFSYAKTAIHFQCLEYLLKPVDEEELDAALKKAVQACQNARELEQHKHQTVENYRIIEEQFLLELSRMTDKIDQEKLKIAMAQKKIHISLDYMYLAALFSVKKWNEPYEKGSGDLLHRFKEGLETFLSEKYKEVKAVILNFTMILVLIPYKEKEYEKMAFAITCQRFIEAFQAKASSRFSAYLCKAFYLWELPEIRRKLMQTSEDSVLISHVSVMDEQEFTQNFELPEISAWQYFLKTEKYQDFLESIRKIFGRLENELNLNVRTLFIVWQNFLQTVYSYADSQDLFAAQIFTGVELMRLEENALKNTDDFMAFAEYILRKIQETKMMDQSLGAVAKAEAYIKEHLKEKISCNELGRICYLNPDYLTRCFKKIKGMSMTSYIAALRMEKAKSLLLMSEIPVSHIASQVGYDNYTHFVKTFEKYTGMTPKEYRIKSSP